MTTPLQAAPGEQIGELGRGLQRHARAGAGRPARLRPVARGIAGPGPEISGTAAYLAGAAREMSWTTEETGAAVEQIATATGTVAIGVRAAGRADLVGGGRHEGGRRAAGRAQTRRQRGCGVHRGDRGHRRPDEPAWPSTPRSRLRGPASTGVASPSSPMRSVSWRSPRPRPSRRRAWPSRGSRRASRTSPGCVGRVAAATDEVASVRDGRERVDPTGVGLGEQTSASTEQIAASSPRARRPGRAPCRRWSGGSPSE